MENSTNLDKGILIKQYKEGRNSNNNHDDDDVTLELSDTKHSSSPNADDACCTKEKPPGQKSCSVCMSPPLIQRA